MNGKRQLALELALLVCLLAAACLVYLDWWRDRELEQLSPRVDKLEHTPRKRATPKATEGAT